MSQNDNTSGASFNWTFYPTHSCIGNPCTICYPMYTYTWPAKTPHKCPVCEGRCTVPPGFYKDADVEFHASCRACLGVGVLWS